MKQNTYTEHFQKTYNNTPYYRKDMAWDDYEPAYRYAESSYNTRSGRTFDQIENDLERGWDKARANSRLAWNEAKEAVRDGWHMLERAMPGDADRDGR